MLTVDDIGPLSGGDARAALTEPAQAAGGVAWSIGALDRVVAAARGYPYFLQHFASAIWDVATVLPISEADAELGIDRAQADLADSLVRARLTNLAPRERRYVVALATLGPGVHAWCGRRGHGHHHDRGHIRAAAADRRRRRPHPATRRGRVHVADVRAAGHRSDVGRGCLMNPALVAAQVPENRM